MRKPITTEGCSETKKLHIRLARSLQEKQEETPDSSKNEERGVSQEHEGQAPVASNDAQATVPETRSTNGAETGERIRTVSDEAARDQPGSGGDDRSVVPTLPRAADGVECSITRSRHGEGVEVAARAPEHVEEWNTAPGYVDLDKVEVVFNDGYQEVRLFSFFFSCVSFYVLSFLSCFVFMFLCCRLSVDLKKKLTIC